MTRAIQLVLCLLICLAGCGSDEERLAEHLSNAQRHFAAKQYPEAAVECRNVLEIDPKHRDASRMLATSLYHEGEWRKAFPHLLTARTLDPSNLETRLLLATVHIQADNPVEAWTEVAEVLRQEPERLAALVLAAELATEQEHYNLVGWALDRASDDAAESPQLHISLGRMHIRRGDLENAEFSFREAVRVDPDSADAHVALGEFEASRNSLADAESQLSLAVKLETGESKAARVKLAALMMRTGRREEARRKLEEVVAEHPGVVAAWRHLAVLRIDDGDLDGAQEAVDVLLEKSPYDPTTLFLSARLHLAAERTHEAIEGFRTVLKINPDSGPAYYGIAQAELVADNIVAAEDALEKAIAVAPTFTQARLALADLRIRGGNPKSIISDLERLTGDQPRLLRSHELLGQAYFEAGQYDKAVAVHRELIERHPKSVVGLYLLGRDLRALGQMEESRQLLERSLQYGPRTLDALGELADGYLQENRADLAAGRIKEQIALVGESPPHQLLLAEVESRGGMTAEAVASYQRALELDPRIWPAYISLANLQNQLGQPEEATKTLKKALDRNPASAGAGLLLAEISTRGGDLNAAQGAYEQLLARDPSYAPAANNLALIVAAQGDLERAHSLAQTAHRSTPDDPRIGDTYGWILHLRESYEPALAVLQASAQKLPNDPEVLYHLGATQFRLGDRQAARETLGRALGLSSNFQGAGDAKNLLNQLGG